MRGESDERRRRPRTRHGRAHVHVRVRVQPRQRPRRAEDLRSSARFCRAARLTLESRFTEVRVEGEVSGLKRSGPGHLYFSLKDDEAQLDCVLFSREA